MDEADKKPILETISIQCRTYILGLYGLYTRYDIAIRIITGVMKVIRSRGLTWG